MAYIGGLRARLVKDSAYYMIKDSLDQLNWFDPNREHAPISFIPEAIPENTEIPFNTMALSDENSYTTDIELGSGLVEKRWTFVIDFYASNSALGLHMAEDISSILEGRFPSIGRHDPILPVKDYSIGGNNPPEIFICEIENVTVDRIKGWPKPFQQFWYIVTFDILDCYWNEDDA